MGSLAQYTTPTTSAGGGVPAIAWVAIVVIYAILIVAWWVVFTKAGEQGWKSLIPIYNVWVILKIIGRPGWWLILMFIPFVNIVVGIIVAVDLAKSFGKGVGFAIGLILLSFIFYPVLAFSDARYQGPAAAPGGGVAPPASA
jgi:ABC-type sulfate transport system permease subunit